VKVKLSKEIIDGLPAPDSQGLVRVKAALKLSGDGMGEIVEVNDQPVPVGNDDDEPMPERDLPDLSNVESDLYRP
jgi:hypothetical protein